MEARLRPDPVPRYSSPMKVNLKSDHVPCAAFSWMATGMAIIPYDSDITTDARPNAPFASLPSELITQICGLLRQQGSISALASLRLTSRRFVGLVNEHLFSTVYLNRRMNSLFRLNALSHTPLASFVREIKLDVEPVFRKMTWIEWLLNVNSFGRWPVPEYDRWWGRPAYEMALSQEIDSLTSITALRGRWMLYQLELASQNRMTVTPDVTLCTIMWWTFKRLTNLTTVDCSAWMSSKNVFPLDASLPDAANQVRRIFKRTLTLPRIKTTHRQSTIWSNTRDSFPKHYAAIVLSAATHNCPNLQHVRLTGITRMAFNWERKLLESLTMPNLTRICLAPLCRFGNAQEGSVYVFRFIKMAPNLKELELSISCMPGSLHRPRGYTRFDIDSLDWHLPCLEKLVLRDIVTLAQELQGLIECLPISMKRVELVDVSITQGQWINIFDCMHKCSQSSLWISLHGVLLEGSSPKDKHNQGWLVGIRDNKSCLLSRVLDYIHNSRVAPPMRSLEKGGSSGEWRLVSDNSLRYMRAL